MTAELRGPAFRAALNEALRELDEINEKLVILHARRQLLEAASDALKPMVNSRFAQHVAQEKTTPQSLEYAEPTSAPASAPVLEMPAADKPREAVTDPLQRQINQALGLAALA